MKIAIAQINPTIADISGNLKLISDYAVKAHRENADLVIFPELAITGYPPMDLLEFRKLIDENLQAMESLAGLGTCPIICGYVERDADRPSVLYNAAAFISGGKINSRHFKTLLPEYDVFDEERYFSPAAEHHLAHLHGKKIGITICEDIWEENKFSGNRKTSVSPVDICRKMGADIIVNISASPFVKGKNGIKRAMISSLAKKTGLEIIYVNQVGGNDSLIFDGNSFAAGSGGSVLYSCPGFHEGLFFYEQGKKYSVPRPEPEIIEIKKALELGIRDYVKKCGFKSAVIGLSGGIDSALTAALAAGALGPDCVTGITMPSKYSSQGSIDDSIALGRNLGIEVKTIPINRLMECFEADLYPLYPGMPRDTTEENIQARIRGTILMSFSNKTGSMLLSTGNKSELAMGYCTLYGDMSGGLAVISDLPKTLVYELARFINSEREIIPQNSIIKPPSAELRENQKDEDSLPPYGILDGILELYIEEKLSASEIVSQGFDPETVFRVLDTVNRNEYKRRQAAPGLKITSKAFGTGWRMPLASKFIP